MRNEVTLHLRLSRGVVAGAALAAALVVGFATVGAVFAQDEQTINGCVSTKKGTLRVIDPPSTCTSKETPISWQRGDGNADTLDGLDSTDFLRSDGKAADAFHADEADHAEDADTLEGKQSHQFAAGKGPDGIADNADKLDNKDSSGFLSSDIYDIPQLTTGLDQTSYFEANGTCDEGDKLLTGGFASVDAGTQIIASRPQVNIDAWTVRWINDSTPDTIEMFVKCADNNPGNPDR